MDHTREVTGSSPVTPINTANPSLLEFFKDIERFNRQKGYHSRFLKKNPSRGIFILKKTVVCVEYWVFANWFNTDTAGLEAENE